jgi:hypothetical protein
MCLATPPDALMPSNFNSLNNSIGSRVISTSRISYLLMVDSNSGGKKTVIRYTA